MTKEDSLLRGKWKTCLDRAAKRKRKNVGIQRGGYLRLPPAVCF
jgi:hypothetical protein